MPKISVVSCVNDFDKYNCCVGNSFQQEQRDGTVELIPIDNTANTLTAPEALNQGLKKATGEIAVFSHQDVKFPQGWIEKLLEQISIIDRTHKNWGVLGTFGVAKDGSPAGHIIDCGVQSFIISILLLNRKKMSKSLAKIKRSAVFWQCILGSFYSG